MPHKIRVITYAGYRGDERPLAFIMGDTRIVVEALLETWVEEESISGKRKRFFRVKGRDGLYYRLYVEDAPPRSWFLVDQTPTMPPRDSKA